MIAFLWRYTCFGGNSHVWYPACIYPADFHEYRKLSIPVYIFFNHSILCIKDLGLSLFCNLFYMFCVIFPSYLYVIDNNLSAVCFCSPIIEFMNKKWFSSNGCCSFILIHCHIEHQLNEQIQVPSWFDCFIRLLFVSQSTRYLVLWLVLLTASLFVVWFIEHIQIPSWFDCFSEFLSFIE